jgi:transcription elongation factor S-II
VSKEKRSKTSSSPPVSAPSAIDAPRKSSTTTTLQKKFVSEGPRNFKNDNVKIDIYENRTRNNVVGALYNGLCIDSEHPPHVLLKVSKDIENELFTLEKFDTTKSSYTNKARSLASNLRQKNNPELRTKINNGDLSPKDFVTTDPRDLAPEHLKKQLEDIKKQNLYNAQGATQERAVTDRFTCGKCKEKKVSYYQLQTRSADEPLTTFCTCENCGNRWKFS